MYVTKWTNVNMRRLPDDIFMEGNYQWELLQNGIWRRTAPFTEVRQLEYVTGILKTQVRYREIGGIL